MKAIIRSILHPTDLSQLSGSAFAHALRIGVAARSKLKLLHVDPHEGGEAITFPNVGKLLVQWGLPEKHNSESIIAKTLGLEVENISFMGNDPARDVVVFLHQHSHDLVVMATHGRDGIDRWLKGSVSEDIFRHAPTPTLFITHNTRGFVSPVSGDVRLRRMLVPVDFSPQPSPAIDFIQKFGQLLIGANVTIYPVHVGRSAPPVDASLLLSDLPPVILRTGDVVQSIVDAALEYDVDLIGMPTAGHHGIFDVLRGSTTERVIRHAPCPVFAVPVG
jgi:nucleotide-binding universal stress UspA family protein